MPFSIDRPRGGLILKLEGAVTIRHAQELAAGLVEGLEDGPQVAAVETAGLEEVDTCVLQILYSLRKTIPALSFDAPSAAFVAAMDRCGLRRELLGAREGL
jgi:anti-anti-sigma regulatory factor